MNFKFQSKFISIAKFQIRSIWTSLLKLKNEKDYYSILKVSPNATFDEIKEAYAKLAKQHDLEGRKKSRFDKPTKIREIIEAYDVLSDAMKRIKYDEALGESKLMKIFRTADKYAFPTIKSGDVVKVSITYMQSLRGVIKNISTNVTVRCRKCEGGGLLYRKDIAVCQICAGSGIQIIPGYTNIPVMKCMVCRGEGKTNRMICDWCNSTGRILNENNILLRLAPGRKDGDIIKLKYGKSHLIAMVQIKPDSQKHFTRDGLNIYSELEIPLSKAILGGLVYIKGIYGGATVKLDPGMLCGVKLVFPRKGIRKANTEIIGYHIAVIKVRLPTKLTDSQRTLIKELR